MALPAGAQGQFSARGQMSPSAGSRSAINHAVLFLVHCDWGPKYLLKTYFFSSKGE